VRARVRVLLCMCACACVSARVYRNLGLLNTAFFAVRILCV